ncbi:threonine synthase [Haladaptatus sp. NG-SE-30]
MVNYLSCSACGRDYPAGPDEPWRCECGHPLDFAGRPLPDRPAPDFTEIDTREGLWAFSEFLPVRQVVTLGEGFTPLVDADDWNAQFKLDCVFPSGSFKDRGATATLSRAAELGVETVLEDSSGNAGAAIAQYAARAGIDAEIYVPADAKASKLQAIERAGATPVRIEGTRQDVTDACIEAVEAGEGWYASHAWNPAFFAGTMTFALELAAQRDWSVPDAVVSPLGHGTLFLGAYRGFRALSDAGWIDEMPRLLGVQAEGVAPIADELHDFGEGDTDENETDGGNTDEGRNDVADGIQITHPARREQIVDAIEATGGDAIALDAEATQEALDRLHRTGFYVEPTSAVAVAGLSAYRERGVLAEDADVVVPLTGHGLKS